jgi:23S rRNA (cytidine1920-2'-O)/16S rRNA (cytidine1409-2'-O)-methyltransferase
MRLDLYLVEHGLAKTRSQASDLIKRSLVLVDGEIAGKTGVEITTQHVELIAESKYVSRAGEKLAQALIDFNIDLRDKIAIDIGSSTGGFTDCAIQHGIRFVYAYDVGSHQMDERLKESPLIELHEETNILSVQVPHADIIFIDVSFTSIKPIFKHLEGFQGEMVCLIKPQFEAGPEYLKQGILKNPKRTKEVLVDVLSYARSLGFSIAALKASHLKGKSGNQEYILYIKEPDKHQNLSVLIGEALC